MTTSSVISTVEEEDKRARMLDSVYIAYTIAIMNPTMRTAKG